MKVSQILLMYSEGELSLITYCFKISNYIYKYYDALIVQYIDSMPVLM